MLSKSSTIFVSPSLIVLMGSCPAGASFICTCPCGPPHSLADDVARDPSVNGSNLAILPALSHAET